MRSRRYLALLATLIIVCSCTSALAVQRVVLVENFTNTNCAPCAVANPVTQQFMSTYPDQIVLNVQYHVNWPSATDPFYLANSADVNGRRTYYGVNSVPDMVTDGVNAPEPGSYSGLAANVGSQLVVDSPFSFNITTTEVGGQMTVDVDVSAMDDVPATGLKLRMALVEPHVYLDPPGADNGERNFYSTMRRMLPNYNGTDLVITNGQTLSFSQTASIDPTWVGVYAIVWVQNDVTKEVMGAGSTAVTPDFAHYFGHPSPKAVGPMLETQAFHTKIMNVGSQGDVYDMTMTYDHPANWGASVCIGEDCLAPGTTSQAVPVAAGREQELSIDITPIVDKGQGSITVTVTSQNNPANTWTTTFSVIASGTAVLLVDDDAGESYDEYYKSAIDATSHVYGTWDRDGDGKVSGDLLKNFYAVVWNVGWGFPSLDADDRAAIGAYLDAGGSLFVTGQDIGWDFFDPSGSQYGTAAIAWYRNYLGAVYYNDDTNDLTITGIADDVIGDGLAFNIGGGDGANNQQYPSEIHPDGLGIAVLEYSAGREAGVRHEKNGFKTVYFSFGFEGIATAADRSLIMDRVLNWLVAPAPVGDNVPVKPYLASMPIAAPNPFNPATEIQFEIGGQNPAAVKIDLYDVAGRKIRSLFEGNVQPGPQRFDWNGRNDSGSAAASGLYLARVTVDGETRSLKMTLAK